MSIFRPRSVLVLSLLAATTAMSQDTPQPAKTEEARPRVSLETVYLSQPIGTAHRIVVTGELGGKGALTLDGNTCTTDRFGDRSVCTKINFPPHEIEMVQLRLVDSGGLGRRIYGLQGEQLPAGFEFFLIIPRRRSEPHRLVVDTQQGHRRVVTLEAIRRDVPRGKPALAKKGEYRAEQAEGQVTLFASGEHPTAGWKVAIEQLPIRIFPPQYRLVVVPPIDAAAQVVTPFEVKVSFKANQRVPIVTIHDAAGPHRVPVTSVNQETRP